MTQRLVMEMVILAMMVMMMVMMKKRCLQPIWSHLCPTQSSPSWSPAWRRDSWWWLSRETFLHWLAPVSLWTLRRSAESKAKSQFLNNSDILLFTSHWISYLSSYEKWVVSTLDISQWVTGGAVSWELGGWVLVECDCWLQALGTGMYQLVGLAWLSPGVSLVLCLSCLTFT